MPAAVEERDADSGDSRRTLTRLEKTSSPECSVRDLEENEDSGSEEKPSRESSYRPMELGPDQILVPLKPIDYVLVYEDTDYAARDVKSELFSKLTNSTPELVDLGKLRRVFYNAMIEEDLEVREERVGKRIFVKIHCPFERLCKAAEQTRLECALAGLVFETAPKKKKKGLAKKIKGLLDMKDETPKIYTPFLDTCREWFLGNHDRETYFRSAVRYLLVHHILININIHEKVSHLVPAGKRMIGLNFMLLKKAYLDAFVLHDLSALETYSSIPCFDINPPPQTANGKGRSPNGNLELREFGDENTEQPQYNDEYGVNGMRVALDTRKILNKLWVGFCKSQPLDKVKDYYGEKIAFYFGWVGSLITSLWIPSILGITVFAIGVIERMDDDIKFLHKDGSNKTAGYKDVVYYVEVMKASSDNLLTPFFAFVICVWGTVQSEIWTRKQITLAHRWHMDTFDEVEPDRPTFEGTHSNLNHVTGEVYYYYPASYRIMKFIASCCSLVLMVCVVFISVTSVIVYRVYSTAEWCVGDSTCSLLHGAIIPTVLNTISIMLLGQIYQHVAVKLTEWENHRTDSNYSDSLVFKLFAFQFANTYTSLFYVAFFRRDIGGDDGIMGMGPKYQDNCHSGRNDSCMSMLSFQLLSHMIIKPLPKFFKDIVVPQIKKLYMRFDPKRIRVMGEGDPSKQHYLLREMYKPPVEDFTREEMNEKIIQYGYLVMFSASLPIAPLMVLIMNLIDMRVDARRLLWLNRRPMAYQDNDIGMWMNILAFLNICGVCTNALLLAFTADFGREKGTLSAQLIIVLIFEHAVFAVKFLLMIMIPDIPTSVSNEKKLSQHFVGYLMTKLGSLQTKLVNSKTVLENPTLHENTKPGEVARPTTSFVDN